MTDDLDEAQEAQNDILTEALPPLDESKKPMLKGTQKRLLVVKMAKPFRLWDLVTYGILAVMIVIVMLVVLLPRKSVTAEMLAVVKIDGIEISRYSLANNGEYALKNGASNYLVIVIKDLSISVKNSTCPDHVCEKMYIYKTGQQIICLVNKISISLSDNEMGGGEILPNPVG